MDYITLTIGIIAGLLIGYIVATIKAKYEHARSMTKQYMGFKNILIKIILVFVLILIGVILYFKFLA
jgi:hypothetical protein